MQIITITGRCGKDAETRTTPRGDKVTSVNVAVDQGYGQDKTTNWFRVSLWGDRGEKLAQYIRKGEKVAVTGELTFDSYDGKPQYNVRANDIDPFMSSKGEGNGGGHAPRPDTRPEQNPYDPGLDDHVPFASCDPALECRVR